MNFSAPSQKKKKKKKRVKLKNNIFYTFSRCRHKVAWIGGKKNSDVKIIAFPVESRDKRAICGIIANSGC